MGGFRQQTEDQILDRAAALFARRGFAKTSVQDVADAVGLSKAGLLHHFPSKDALHAAVLGAGRRARRAGARRRSRDLPLGPRARPARARGRWSTSRWPTPGWCRCCCAPATRGRPTPATPTPSAGAAALRGLRRRPGDRRRPSGRPGRRRARRPRRPDPRAPTHQRPDHRVAAAHRRHLLRRARPPGPTPLPVPTRWRPDPWLVLLSRLGAFAHRHRLAVVLVWLVVLVGGGVGAVTLAGETSNTFSIPGQESTTALERITEEFGAGGRRHRPGGRRRPRTAQTADHARRTPPPSATWSPSWAGCPASSRRQQPAGPGRARRSTPTRPPPTAPSPTASPGRRGDRRAAGRRCSTRSTTPRDRRAHRRGRPATPLQEAPARRRRRRGDRRRRRAGRPGPHLRLAGRRRHEPADRGRRRRASASSASPSPPASSTCPRPPRRWPPCSAWPSASTTRCSSSPATGRSCARGADVAHGDRAPPSAPPARPWSPPASPWSSRWPACPSSASRS